MSKSETNISPEFLESLLKQENCRRAILIAALAARQWGNTRLYKEFALRMLKKLENEINSI